MYLFKEIRSRVKDILGKNRYEKLKALKQLPREKIELSTNFVPHTNKKKWLMIQYNQRIKLQPMMTIKGSAEYARSCCEASLKRLQVDYVDLYYIHRIDTTVPIEETMGEIKKMVEEGKVKYIGLSEASAETVRKAHAVHPITWNIQFGHVKLKDKIIPDCSVKKYHENILMYFFKDIRSRVKDILNKNIKKKIKHKKFCSYYIYLIEKCTSHVKKTIYKIMGNQDRNYTQPQKRSKQNYS
ncbi:hypothetical protein ACJIZ3_008981 [Penstemon smallii]|uniref:NADP-dependent oxidoreductase domain-containing protein n=1 Tax=Penstemon smallii TaxID=265156 RepID=A0ABD3TBA9_9LAMI